VIVALFAGVVATAHQAGRARLAEKVAWESARSEGKRRAEAEAAEALAQAEWQRAERERERADREAALAKAVDQFLVNELLMAGDPNLTRGQKVTVEEVLARAAANVGTAFADRPEVEVGIRDTLARAFLRLGKFPAARAQVTAALALHRRLHGEDHPETLGSRNDLAELLAEEGKPADAERELRDILEKAVRTLGERHPVSLSFRNNLAAHLWRQRRFDEAIPLTRRAHELQAETLGPDHPSTLVSLLNLGIQLRDGGRAAEAEPVMLRALADCERALGDTHPTTISALNNVASLRESQGDLAEAERLFRKVEAASRAALSEQHPKTVTTMNNIADVLRRQGKAAEAEAVYRRVLAVVRAHYPPGHPWLFGALENLAVVCERQGKLVAAEEAWRDFYQAAVKPPRGITDRLTLRVQAELARVLAVQKKWADAENMYAAALALQVKALGANHADVQPTREGLAAARLARDKPAEAEQLFRDWLKYCPKLAPPWWREHHVTSLLGQSLLAQQKYAEAEPLLLQGYRGLRANEDLHNPEVDRLAGEARGRLVRLYEAWGKPVEAARWREGPAPMPREVRP
jgi:tetratricopeptide (TPR) repeat protein